MPGSVSILIPTYQPNTAFLREAVQSVLAQTHTNWQLLIHDDASDVDVMDGIAPFLLDPRIRAERNIIRLGIGGNWNACLQQASGDYVAFLFQDDVWHPEYLKEAVAALEREPRVGLVASFHAYQTDGSAEAATFLKTAGFDAVQETRRHAMQPGQCDGRVFLKMWTGRGLHPNLIGEPSFVVLRKSVVDKVGFFREDMPQGLDLEYWTRALLASDLFTITRESGFFRVHPSAASMQNDQTGAGLTDRLRCIESLMSASTTPRDLKDIARQTFSFQLSMMFRKARKRREEGKSMGKGNARSVLPILLHHPLLTLQSLVMSGQKNQE